MALILSVYLLRFTRNDSFTLPPITLPAFLIDLINFHLPDIYPPADGWISFVIDDRLAIGSQFNFIGNI